MLVALAAVASAISFSGWLFDTATLRGFGPHNLPMWPLTSLGYVLLSLGFLAWIFGHPRLASGLWAGPVLIGLLALYQSATGVDLGVDRLLFRGLVERVPTPHPGRPGSSSILLLLLLASAGYAARARHWLSHEVGGLMATLALTLAGAAAILILFSTPGATGSPFAMSVPSAITASCLTIALLTLNNDLPWVRTLTEGRTHWRALRVLLPVALFLPVLPSLIEITLLDNSLITPMYREFVVMLCNILIVAFVVCWAVTRVASEQAAMVQLSQALDSTTVVLTTPDGMITHWSRGCETLYGWSAAEATGQCKYALLRSRCESQAPGLPRARDRGALELVETCRNGREIAVLERVHYVENRGMPVRVLNLTDISDRVLAIQALTASEERLAIATSAHELGIFEWDVATNRILWSPGTEQRLGLASGALGDFDKWRALAEDEDVEGVLETIGRAIDEHADKFNFRYRFRLSNGGVRAIEGSSRAFYDSDGKLVRTVGAIVDVTERDAHEAALQRREAQLRSILETVPDAMVVIDEAGTILQFSAAAESLWGYRADQMLHKPATLLAPADTRGIHLALLERFIATGEGLIGRVYSATAETAAGRHVPIEIRTGVARTDDGTLLTMFVRDMSEQLETEARLSELNADIAHVSRQSAMSELAADLAHELNQPLAATSNFLAAARMLLQRGESGERVGELLAMGNEQTQRAGEIIRRMRAFMASGEVEMRTELVEGTVRDAAKLVMVGTAQFGIRLAYHFDAEARCIFADRVQVQQVLVNLMRNAMEALRNSNVQDRQLTISSHKMPDQMVEITVSDNGAGIPANVLEHLFSRFTTTKAKCGGMGIGLSISKRIVEAHGGILSAANRPEGGACFRFTLPAVEQGVE